MYATLYPYESTSVSTPIYLRTRTNLLLARLTVCSAKAHALPDYPALALRHHLVAGSLQSLITLFIRHVWAFKVRLWRQGFCLRLARLNSNVAWGHGLVEVV